MSKVERKMNYRFRYQVIVICCSEDPGMPQATAVF